MPRMSTIVSFNGAPSQKIREIRSDSKGAMVSVLKFWWINFFPRRFQQGAAERYKFTRRTEAYRKRKRRKFGHTKPLVYTGRMERELKRSYRIMVNSSNRGRIIMQGPRYLYVNYNRKSSKPIRKREELVKLLKQELIQLGKVMQKSMLRRLNSYSGPVEIRKVR